jgi:hypothetical protein
MKARLSLTCLAVLASCGPAPNVEPATSPSPEPSVAAALPLEPVGKLAGEYRVAGINSEDIDAPFGLALSASDNRITFAGPSGGYSWDYRLVETRLATTRAASPDPACLATARIHHLVFDLAAALDRATQAGRTPSNGITLSGGGRSVTLYSQ